MATEESRTGRVWCDGERVGKKSSSPQNVRLVNVFSSATWVGRASGCSNSLSHRAAGSINSTSNVLAPLTVPSTSALLSSSLLTSPLPSSPQLSPWLPLFFTLLQYLHRHRIRRFPHYILLLLEFTKKLEKRPWKFFCLRLHSTRSGEQRLAPNLVVAANSNVRPALTLTLSLTRGF